MCSTLHLMAVITEENFDVFTDDADDVFVTSENDKGVADSI